MPPLRWPERAARILAVLCLIVVVLLNGRPYFTTFSIPPRGIRDPHVALQMVRSVAEVDAILGDAPSPDREAMRMKQYIDFAFIAFYAALFVVISIALGTADALGLGHRRVWRARRDSRRARRR